MHQVVFIVLCLLVSISGKAQFLFEGQVDAADWNGQAYLSEISDYRKLEGVFNEQLIQRVEIDSFGVFRFIGDDLPTQNRLYRIHVDRCASYEQEVNHFTGNCEHSKAMIIIANNRDTITMPQGFEQEIFCQAISTNEATNAILKVDSLMEAMKYDFVGLRSETATDKLLNQWFDRFYELGESSDPLVGVYIYSKLTDRSTIFYDHYKQNITGTDYFNNLANRLESKYADLPLTRQYQQEFQADIFSFESTADNEGGNGFLYAGLISSLLLIIAIYWYGRKRPGKVKHGNLTEQEKRVYDLIKAGKTNKEIAAELFISHSTVKSHVNNIYRKLGVTSREEIKKLKIR